MLTPVFNDTFVELALDQTEIEHLTGDSEPQRLYLGYSEMIGTLAASIYSNRLAH